MPQWIEVVIRTLVSVVVLYLLTKLLGKRQISQLSLFEYITGITIGSITAYVSLDVDTGWYLGIISMFVWVVVSYGIELLTMKSKIARNLIEGKSTVLIQDGKILEDNLRKEKLTNEELLEQLRKQGIFKAAQVEFAVMETDGTVNAMLKNEYQPVTPEQLGLQVTSESEPQTVILDGDIVNGPLAILKLDRSWLINELKKRKLAVDDVFLAQVDSQGQLYIDLYNDQHQNHAPSSSLQSVELFANLKKCAEQLDEYASSAADKSVRQICENGSVSLKQLLHEIKS